MLLAACKKKTIPLNKYVFSVLKTFMRASPKISLNYEQNRITNFQC